MYLVDNPDTLVIQHKNLFFSYKCRRWSNTLHLWL